MPRFFFHLRHDNGELDRDDDGVDLPDFESAYLEAHRGAVDMWAEGRRDGQKLTYSRFEIRDAGDRLVLERRSTRWWVSTRRCRRQSHTPRP